MVNYLLVDMHACNAKFSWGGGQFNLNYFVLDDFTLLTALFYPNLPLYLKRLFLWPAVQSSTQCPPATKLNLFTLGVIQKMAWDKLSMEYFD